MSADVDEPLKVAVGPVMLEGNLILPGNAQGVVFFAHGSGSSRHSSRNRYVAGELRKAGLGTLLMDLLTLEEERVDEVTLHVRFDIGLLAERLIGATEWLKSQNSAAELPIGLFGASTGGGAVMVAAAKKPELIDAVVSRGGRADLAGEMLPQVQAPTLLIVGGNDYGVIELNRMALEQLRCEKRMVLVPGATHLFEEPGTLDEVARLAADWFAAHLKRPVGASARADGSSR